jgi:predicted RNA-binding Zn-ribbon protein involved in translation (DUF1610 family)
VTLPAPVDRKLGFIGCSVTGRLICVGLVEGVDQKPRSVVFECPLCGNTHSTPRASWRDRREGEADRVPDVVVGADGRQIR